MYDEMGGNTGNSKLAEGQPRVQVAGLRMSASHVKLGAGATVMFVAGILLGGSLGGGGSPHCSKSEAAVLGPPGSLNSWGHPRLSDAIREQRALARLDADVRAMLDGMSTAQKVGQMTQFNIDEAFAGHGNGLPTDSPDTAMDLIRADPRFVDAPWELVSDKLVRTYAGAPHFLGSWLNSPFSGDTVYTSKSTGARRSGLNATEWRLMLRKIQGIHINECGARICPPMVFGLDSVHGAIYVRGATIFPHQINQAATFNTASTQQAGRITAKDTKAAGIPWIFAPILGIATQPGWSRVMETFGECPRLAAEMGAAVIRGMQGGEHGGCANGACPLSSPQAAAACAKHFIGYSASEGSHDRQPTVIPDRHLLQYYAPSFQAAFDVGVASVMNAYTEINGEPMASSRKYLVR
jgi:hypothetical protein|eukprot:COSAG01_NODE_2259_length_8058_cov_440.944340_1_plen_409_part_00